MKIENITGATDKSIWADNQSCPRVPRFTGADTELQPNPDQFILGLLV
jgi:hypothetical protein